MAHEGGHLLLGMNSHSNHGLMSGRWEQEEFNKIAEGRVQLLRSGEEEGRKERSGKVGGGGAVVRGPTPDDSRSA